MKKRILTLALCLLLCALPAHAASQALHIIFSGASTQTLTIDLSAAKTVKLSVSDAALIKSGEVSWSSSAVKTAYVDSSGKVTALKNGTATITASAKDGTKRKASLKLTVVTSVTDLSLKGSSSMLGGKSQKLTATVSPATASNASLSWLSSDTGVATVDQAGKVTAKKVASASSAVITAVAKDGSGISAKKKITVNPCAEMVVLSDSSKMLRILEGEYSCKFTAYCLPSGASQTILWKSSNSAVATVDSGTVTAVKAGKTTITAYATDGSGVKASAKVTVTGKRVLLATAADYLEMDWADDTGEKYGVTGYSRKITRIIAIPKKADGYSVRAIGDGAFSESPLPGVVIPDTVSYIGDEAFMGCKKLTFAYLSASLTYLGESAFAETPIRSVTIPDTLKSIEASAFAECRYLKTVTIPANVSTVGESAFEGCARLKTVTMKYGVKTIGDGAFASCKSLKKIVIPSSVTSIGDDAFEGSKNVVIYGRAGSKAQSYAKAHGIRFTLSNS